MIRALLAAGLLLLSGCTPAQESAFYPNEFRASVAQGFDDDGRNPRTTVTTELHWPLKPGPTFTQFYPEPGCTQEP